MPAIRTRKRGKRRGKKYPIRGKSQGYNMAGEKDVRFFDDGSQDFGWKDEGALA